MCRIIHRQTLLRRFTQYLRNLYPAAADNPGRSEVNPSSLNSFEPLAFAIFYSAINSMGPEGVLARYGKEKKYYMEMYKLGVELSLERENFLSTSSLEVLQGFLLLLVCHLCRELLEHRLTRYRPVNVEKTMMEQPGPCWVSRFESQHSKAFTEIRRCFI